MTTAANHPDIRQPAHRNVTVARESIDRRRPGRPPHIGQRLASLVRFPPSPERTTRIPAGWDASPDDAPHERRSVMRELIQALPNWLLCGALTFIIAHGLGLFSQ